jgi:LysM repeat protein
MKLALQLSAAGFTAVLLSSCGNNGSTAANNPYGTGPFDSRGNYVEEWADNPSKWKRGGGGVPSKPGESLVINDEPPANSIPIPTPENTPQPGQIRSTTVVSKPTPITTARRATTSPSPTKSKPSTAATSKPKPKTVAAKPKPKSPATSRYTIKKGDTLSAIAARNRTSVAALQRANGIKGSLIQPGKTLVIPK